MEKITKRDRYLELRSLVADHPELVEFIDHELDLLEKKNASRSLKPSKKQVANADLADAIYNAMEDGVAYRIADIKGLVDELADANSQKVTALVTKLRKEIRVSREMVKGVAWFTKIWPFPLRGGVSLP